MEVGDYCHISDSLHVYEKDAADLQASNSVEEAPNIDSLALARRESDVVLSEMNRLMSEMMVPDLSRDTLSSIMSSGTLPPSYQNLLLVVAADSARRRGWTGVAEELMAGCSNPALIQAWKGWAARCWARQKPRSIEPRQPGSRSKCVCAEP